MSEVTKQSPLDLKAPELTLVLSALHVPQFTISRRPPPRLPWDVLLIIVKQSDDGTLVVLSGACFEFLVATVPILYRDVEIKSVKGLWSLFCERDVTTNSRINPILSLSRVKTLTLDFTSLTSYPTSLTLHRSRLVSSNPLPLTSLSITLLQQHRPFLSPFYITLFPLLAPTALVYNILNRSPNDDPFFIVNFDAPFQWTHLSTLDLAGGIPLSWGARGWQVAAVPFPRRGGTKRTIRLHLASLGALRKIVEKHAMFGFDELKDGDVVLVVKDEVEKRKAEKAVSRVEVGRRSLFSIEIED